MRPLLLKTCVFVCVSVMSAELRELVSMHAAKEKENEEPLNYDEVLIIKV